MSRRAAIGGLASACVVAAFVGAASTSVLASGTSALQRSTDTQWSWFLSGRGRPVGFGRPVAAGNGYGGATDLIVNVAGDATWGGGKLRLTGVDGNLELEHGSSSPVTELAAASSRGGAAPMQIGAADGQNVIPLLVEGTTTGPAETWSSGGRTIAGVGTQGVTLDGVTLEASLDSRGRVVVSAVLDGKSEPVLVGRPVQRSSR